MKNKISLIVTILSFVTLLIALPPLLQASIHTEATANIPFDFYLKDKLMPAGDYSVARDDSGLGIIFVRNVDKPIGIYSLFTSEPSKQPMTTGKLVFHKYGDQYFLSEVWNPLLNARLVPPTSGLEKKARKAAEEIHVSSKMAPQEIEIALNFQQE